MKISFGSAATATAAIVCLALTICSTSLYWCHANVFAGRAHAQWRVAFVGDSLTQFWPYPASNFGQAGAVSEQVLINLERGDMRCRCYRAVVLLAGTNDAVARLPPEKTIRNLDAIVAFAQSQGLKVYIATIPPMYGNYSDRDAFAQATNVGIRAIAQKRGIPLLDYRKAVEGHPEYTWDGVHLLSTGYAVLQGVLQQAHVA